MSVENYLDFFDKIKCDKEFLCKEFENFSIFYGLITPYAGSISDINVDNDTEISYFVHTTSDKVAKFMMNELNDATMTLVDRTYRVKSLDMDEEESTVKITLGLA